MKLYYVKIDKDWDDLAKDDSVTFVLPKKSVLYSIYKYNAGNCLLTGINCSNDKIFSILDVKGRDFVRNIVGYSCNGAFPEVKSLEDLKKVIKALDDECVKKFGIPDCDMKFKVGDTVKILDRVGDRDNYYPSYTDGMLEYAGTLTTIKEIDEDGYLRLDNNNYFWDTKAVKPVNKAKYLHPTELKNGDFIKIWDDWASYIYIFKKYENNGIYGHASFDLNYNDVDTDSHTIWGEFEESTKITYATEEEKQLLNEALLRKGYTWNNSTKELEAIQVSIPSDFSCITIGNPVIDSSVHRKIKYDLFLNFVGENMNKEELNLFPTKKHYQLNFNY